MTRRWGSEKEIRQWGHAEGLRAFAEKRAPASMSNRTHDEAARSAVLLCQAVELLISLGDYTGNVDPRTGIDRCAVVAGLRALLELPS